jgi:hypothetical protein
MIDRAISSSGPSVGANVVCFQRERQSRPSLWLLRQIAPHPEGIGVMAAAFGLPSPPALTRSFADQRMAGLIRRRWLPEQPAARDDALRSLLKPLVEAAVAACWEAEDMFREAAIAQALVLQAEKTGAAANWLASLRVVAGRLTTRAAGLLVVAHLRSEKAEGAARAIGLARQGKAWGPASVDQEVSLAGNDLLADWLSPW